LEAIGALVDFLVITANGPHMLKDEFERVSGRKVLSMIDLAVEEARHRHWRKIGLLGLGEPQVYMQPLDQLGIAYETLSGEFVDLRSNLDSAILALMEGRAGQEGTATAMQAIETLRGKGVDGIILGCTEIPLLLGEAAVSPDIINPGELLAEAAVRYALDAPGN
jgi:aspartate racemase